MPPEQDEFQMVSEDFQAARLFGADKPLLKTIESREQMHSADQKQTIDYAVQPSMNL